MNKFATREAYWKARGRHALADTVQRQTIKELRKKGIRADPTSAVYKNAFNRLAGKYLREEALLLKERRVLEAEWKQEHGNDTDEQLLAYLRSVITDPAKFQKPGKVIGGYLITHRFGSWKNCLLRAGLIESEGVGDACE
jgi:hypothetical protein